MLAVEKRITSPLLVRGCGGKAHASRPCRSSLFFFFAASKRRPAAACAASLGAGCCWRTLALHRGARVQEPRSIDKIAEIDEHIACANSGLTADSRTLIDHGRVETQARASSLCSPSASLCRVWERGGRGRGPRTRVRRNVAISRRPRRGRARHARRSLLILPRMSSQRCPSRPVNRPRRTPVLHLLRR